MENRLSRKGYKAKSVQQKKKVGPRQPRKGATPKRRPTQQQPLFQTYREPEWSPEFETRVFDYGTMAPPQWAEATALLQAYIDRQTMLLPDLPFNLSSISHPPPFESDINFMTTMKEAKLLAMPDPVAVAQQVDQENKEKIALVQRLVGQVSDDHIERLMQMATQLTVETRYASIEKAFDTKIFTKQFQEQFHHLLHHTERQLSLQDCLKRGRTAIHGFHKLQESTVPRPTVGMDNAGFVMAYYRNIPVGVIFMSHIPGVHQSMTYAIGVQASVASIVLKAIGETGVPIPISSSLLKTVMAWGKRQGAAYLFITPLERMAKIVQTHMGFVTEKELAKTLQQDPVWVDDRVHPNWSIAIAGRNFFFKKL